MKSNLVKNSAKVIAISLLLLTTIWSCNKSKLSSNIKGYSLGTIFENSKKVKATIHGQILQEDGTPSIGATVKIGANQTTTDNTGSFNLANIETSENATVVSVNKTGFYNGFSTIHVKNNQNQKVLITILKMENPSTFNTSTGGTINTIGGGTITFEANSIMYKSTNLPYTGDVTVYAKRIDPADAKLATKTPGSLRAIDKNNYEQLLRTYGMVGVEMMDANGNALEIKTGSKAKINMPLDGAWANNAPATIPLWSFNETNGMWVEEGQATKVGNNYEGSVSHFCFWNCDWQCQFYTHMYVTLVQNSIPLANYYVEVTSGGNFSGFAHGYTDQDGSIIGTISAENNLILNVRDISNQVIYTQTFDASQPVNNIVDLGIIEIADVPQQN